MRLRIEKEEEQVVTVSLEEHSNGSVVLYADRGRGRIKLLVLDESGIHICSSPALKEMGFNTTREDYLAFTRI